MRKNIKTFWRNYKSAAFNFRSAFLFFTTEPVREYQEIKVDDLKSAVEKLNVIYREEKNKYGDK
jgi:hypothetical protein